MNMGPFTPAAILLWLFAVATSATNSLVELRASELVTERCHSSVTLHCNIISEDGLKVKQLSWIRMGDGETLCRVNEDAEVKEHDSHRILCNYSRQGGLELTLRHLLPADEGKYFCKLRSNLGIKDTTSAVKVQECFREVDAVPSSSGVACYFYGVYPRGEVHWFDQDKNVTDESRTDNSSKPNHHGMYNLSSWLLPEDRSREYNCSLWIPSTGAYLTSRLVRMPMQIGATNGQSSFMRDGATSAHIVGLGWVLLQTRFHIV